MHKISAFIVTSITVMLFASCASKPQQPDTTTYNQQVSRQADDEFKNKLNENK